MKELIPGLFHWTTFHDGIGARVSSFYVEPAGALIDPRVPDEGLDAFAGRTRPQQVVLTSGLHARHADRFAEAFGCAVRASPQALDRLGGTLDAQPYTDGDEVAPGITAVHIGKLSPDEYALHIELDSGAIAFADGLIRYGGALGFVPDGLIGDDPDAVKEGLKDAFRGLLTRDFDHLLFAHGDPLIGGGKAALRDFLQQPAGKEDYGPAV
ncbi:MAG TPA: hypothetical protein VNT54_17235 [Solirubrobacteraceae bacterium]|nr:hypothetical protein [Solirubrobacteraceae bacterium]